MKIATLTLNPCIDKTLYFGDAFRLDALNRAAYAMTNAGGKGINVARIYRRLGIRATAYGFAGGSVGKMLCDLLATEDIPVSFTETSCDTRMCVKLIDAGGVCTEANEAGGPMLDVEYDALKRELDRFVSVCIEENEEGILFAGGSVPAGLEKSAYRDLISGINRASGGRVRFILDADGEALREGLKSSPWLIKPNAFELSGLVGYEITGKTAMEKARNAAKASRRIASEYHTSVLCTLGGDGAVYTDAAGSTYVNAPRVTLRGFTGAGDTFLASFVFAYEKNGRDIPSALCFASSAAAAKVELAGTEMPDKTAMMRFVEQVQAENLDI